MSNKFSIDTSVIDEELELLSKELDDLDELYAQGKSKLINPTSKSSLMFEQQQIANLTTIKNSKLAIIKERVAIKKIKIDCAIKEHNINSKIEGANGDGSEAIAKNIFAMLMNSNQSDLIKETEQQEKPTDQPSEEEIDDLIAQLLDEDTTESKSEEKVVEETEEEKEFLYVVDTEGNVYVIDKDFNILEDIPIPDFEIEFKEVDSELKAFNQYGDELLIVNKE